MGGVVLVKWYATGFRADDLEHALGELTPLCLRYGARSYAVYRSREDRYRFNQYMAFDEKGDFERFWYGDEFSDFRASCSSWYQVPLTYDWNDLVASGAMPDHEGVAPG